MKKINLRNTQNRSFPVLFHFPLTLLSASFRSSFYFIDILIEGDTVILYTQTHMANADDLEIWKIIPAAIMPDRFFKLLNRYFVWLLPICYWRLFMFYARIYPDSQASAFLSKTSCGLFWFNAFKVWLFFATQLPFAVVVRHFFMDIFYRY